MQKKKVVLHTNYCASKTGFGGFAREILTYLYNTGKYDLTLYAAGTTWSHPDFARWPWKVYGTLPNNQAEIDVLNRDPNLARAANYGSYLIDKLIQEVKPDVYIGIEDPWGIEYCKDKKWWNKISCVIHTTVDSRPLTSSVIDLAKITKHFFCWADFATKDFHKLGIDHVKTMHGTVNTKVYRRLPANQRQEIRAIHNIPQDAYCVGMLSRNQLRKSFPNLVEGYAEFKKQNPEIKHTRLLIFTHFGEGWNIPNLCDEYGVDKNELLATYKCRATGEYFIMPFQGQELQNPKTGHQKSLVTVNINEGLTDEQVNEWYNILDVYAHPFTSGGQERAIQEAKLAELITLVTNYSCGEDCCVPEAQSLPLDYAEYREPTTQFIKATTYPSSISKMLRKVYNMTPQKRLEMGKAARKWTLEKYSIEVIGKQFEELLDSFPLTDYDFNFAHEVKNPTATIPENPDDRDWVKSLYKLILNMEIADNDSGLAYWMTQMENKAPRAEVERYFRDTAAKENQKTTVSDLNSVLGSELPSERVLINIPESLGDCIYITSLLKDAREIYKDKKIYVATKPQFLDVFRPLVGDLIDYAIEWRQEFDNSMEMEGYGNNKGYFRVVLQPHYPTQRMVNYLHHGEKTSKLDLHYPNE